MNESDSKKEVILPSIKYQLFEWDGWDEMGCYDLQFYHCTLNVPFGDLPAGTEVHTISLSFSLSKVELFMTEKSESPDHTFALELKVKPNAAESRESMPNL